MVILLRYTLAFSEVIYADFYAKILYWKFRLVDENSRILVVVFVRKLNFSFSFRFVDENCGISVIVAVDVFVMKTNLFSTTKISVFVHKKSTGQPQPESGVGWTLITTVTFDTSHFPDVDVRTVVYF